MENDDIDVVGDGGVDTITTRRAVTEQCAKKACKSAKKRQSHHVAPFTVDKDGELTCTPEVGTKRMKKVLKEEKKKTAQAAYQNGSADFGQCAEEDTGKTSETASQTAQATITGSFSCFWVSWRNPTYFG